MKICLSCSLIVFLSLTSLGLTQDLKSSWKFSEQPSLGMGLEDNLSLRVIDQATGNEIPFKAILRVEDGRFLDGSPGKRGVYDDGRFFAEGTCSVAAPPGKKIHVQLSHGPEFDVAVFDCLVPLGKTLTVDVELNRWISMAGRGWFSGDNHVHARHDEHGPIATDLAYAALQARAQGLNFITEAGSHVSYETLASLNRPDFQIRHCGEIRPGPFVGHFNPAGLHEPLPPDLYAQLIAGALPGQQLCREVRRRGGIMIHTHPLMPRHQLHWMGASEAWSNAVSGDMADLFDVDGPHTEKLWFALLNLGNRIAVSGHTDAALGRKKTLSPGDNRIYCRAPGVNYDAFIESMRSGRTMATNGGTSFVFFTVNETLEPGDISVLRPMARARLKVESREALASAAIYLNGKRVAAFDVRDKRAPLVLERVIDLPVERDSWLVARVEDKKGKWCLTSPIYFQEPQKKNDEEGTAALLFQICNATRFADLCRDYFAHVIVTVRQPESIARVEILKDDQIVKTYLPIEGNQLPDDGKIPVTGIFGNYADGHLWHPEPNTQAWHLQSDLKIAESGWYRVHVLTQEGREFRSSAMFFDQAEPQSQSLSVASLWGPETELNLWGFGADIEVAKLHPILNKGSWWYPRDIYWRLRSRFGDEESIQGWPEAQPRERFRE